MDWTAPINIYCERLGPGLLAEPVNAITNVAFFIAAGLALRYARLQGRLDGAMTLLIGLTFTVGVGSTLFHTFAQRWALWADVIPILLFIVSYIGIAIWRFFGARPGESVVLAASFLFFASGLRAAATGTLPPVFAPAIGYLPALVALLAAGALLALRSHAAGKWLLATSAVFTTSLTMRSLDMHVCEHFPVGTHFLWHILNGVVLGMLLLTFLRHGARPVARLRRAP
jgi:hypothetical protein